MQRKVQYDPMAVTRELRKLRRQMGLSQQQMGALLSVDWQTIHAWETRKRLPPLMALTLARHLAREHGIDDVPSEPPLEEVTADPKARLKHHWSATFVLMREQAPDARCWYSRHAMPCQGRRFHFVVLMPPHPGGGNLLQTMTCERHAREALYHLRRETITTKGSWIRSKHNQEWFAEWEEALDALPEEKQNA